MTLLLLVTLLIRFSVEFSVGGTLFSNAKEHQPFYTTHQIFHFWTVAICTTTKVIKHRRIHLFLGKLNLYCKTCKKQCIIILEKCRYRHLFTRNSGLNFLLMNCFTLESSYFSDVSLLEQEESWAVFRSVKIT